MYGKTTEKLAFEKKLASIPGGIIFGWLGDKIGRRKVFMMMILTLSFATGVTVRAARRARDRMTQVGRLPRPAAGIAALPAARHRDPRTTATRGWRHAPGSNNR